MCEEQPLGQAILLLVPPQATFDYERAVASATGGSLRVRVRDAETLIDELLGDAGADALDATSRRLLIAQAVRDVEDDLIHFRQGTSESSSVARMLSQIGASGSTPAEIGASLEDADDELAAKLTDLAIIDAAYRRLLGDRLDASGRVRLADEKMTPWSHVFVDGISELRGVDLSITVAAVARSQHATVTFTVDPQQPQTLASGLFEPAVRSIESLRRRLRQQGVTAIRRVDLGSPQVDASPDLRLIERDWSQPRPSQAASSGDVLLYEADDEQGEATAAAAQVLDWLHDGVAPEHCAVLFRQPGRGATLVQQRLAERNVPVFVDRRRPAIHHGVVRLVRALLHVADENWPQAATMSIVRNPLAGLDTAARRAITTMTQRYPLRGRRAWEAVDSWTAWARPGDEAEAEVADAARRRLVAQVAPLAESLDHDRPVRQHVTALRETLDRLALANAVTELADATNDVAAAQDHRIIFANVLDRIDRLERLLGDSIVPSDEFVAALEASLDTLDFAVPPPQRGAVLLGDASRVVLPHRPERVVVVGLSEGTFPAPPLEQAELSAHEVRRLQQSGLDVEDTADHVATERRLAYRAFTLPRDRLTLVRHRHDARGHAVGPSPYWERVRHLLALSPQPAPEIATTTDAVAQVLLWARDGAADAEAATLYEQVRHLPEAAAAWPSLTYENRAVLEGSTKQRLFGTSFDSTARGLEDFAACPFRYFARHTLKLPEPAPAETTARDLGAASHEVLFLLFDAIIRTDLSLADDAQMTATVHRIVSQYAEREGRGLSLETPRGRYLISRLERNVLHFLRRERVASAMGKMQPAHANLQFAKDAEHGLKPLVIETPRGRSVRVCGTIDRLDTTPQGASVAIDFVGGTPASPMKELRLGLAFRMVVSLLVLAEHGDELASSAAEPVASLQIRTSHKQAFKQNPLEAPAPPTEAFYLQNKPRGLIASDGLPLLEQEFADQDEDADSHRQGISKLFTGGITRDGTPRVGDIVSDVTLDKLILRARQAMAEVADGVLDGDIGVRPYLVGKTTPCSTCGYKPLCRFEPKRDGYRIPTGEEFGDG